VKKALALSLLCCAACHKDGAPVGFDWAFFHGDRARTGWNSREATLTPAAVGSGRFGHLWDSASFDHATIGGVDFPPHLYASPLYDDASRSILAATSNGWVYSLSTADGHLHWSLKLADPYVVKDVDGGMALGILSTPALDVAARRLYVVAQSAATHAYAAFAIDVDQGRIVDGWPLALDPAAIAQLNTNGPATFLDPTLLTQRGALNLTADAATLLVPFGTTTDHGTGWMISIDTQAMKLKGAFAVTPLTDASIAGGGIWGSGGPVVDERGDVFDTSGNSDETLLTTPHVWGASLLRWDTSMNLTATYSPWNFCQLEKDDADLGGASPIVLPVLHEATATPRLIAFGGKQGNVYLFDRDRFAGSLTSRPPCSTDSSSDGSLLPPGPQPQFGTRGPLNVFGPYSEIYGNRDQAKMRTTLAWFDAGAAKYVFAVGQTKKAVDSEVSVPPSVARLAVNLSPGAPAYLSIDGTDTELGLINPGAPVLTSKGAAGAVVWVLDENQKRVASLTDPNGARPVLYALDAMTLKVLWHSGTTELQLSGKYNAPLIVGGTVFVGTDRIQAFGLN
jgi:hypothetical protein